MNILGVSCFYHDAAAALIRDGNLIAASEEERFSRKKHDPNFPINAIRSCLVGAGIKARDIAPEAPLFGGDLGLDSIDALELALAVSKRYGFQLRSDNSDNRRIFSSLRALSAHIEQHRAS